MKRGRSLSAPKYRNHKATGQALVAINGKSYYLGKYGSEASKAKYRQLIADKWNAPATDRKANIPDPDEVVTVTRLAIEYGKAAKRKYGAASAEWARIQNVLKTIRATYGILPAHEFGPVRFENYRQSVVAGGLSRSTVNRRAGYVKKMFKHGVKFELIPVELWQRLESLDPVELNGKQSKKVMPVDLSFVRATQTELTPLLADLIEVQLLTGMRPGEVCNLRPCDIDRNEDIWVYKPPIHKTQRYGKHRAIAIGPKAQEVLKRYLLRDHQAFCFTPSEAYKQNIERRRANRKTPLNHGNGPKPRKPKNFRPKYTSETLRKAVHRATERAVGLPDAIKQQRKKLEAWKRKFKQERKADPSFPMPREIATCHETLSKWEKEHLWNPNQLRHSAATIVRKEFDLEAAQVVLGHSSKATTEAFYAEIDLTRGVEFARQFG